MILGKRATELVLVRGFAGPWQSGAEDRSDTSFGLSAAALKGCAEALYARFGRRPASRSICRLQPSPGSRRAEAHTDPELVQQVVAQLPQGRNVRLLEFVASGDAKTYPTR
jgi:hypothetical protein